MNVRSRPGSVEQEQLGFGIFPFGAWESTKDDATIPTLWLKSGWRLAARLGTKVLSSADYTVLDDDGFSRVLVTTGASDRTITLPTAADNTDRVLMVVKADSGVGKVIIDGEGSETVGPTTTFGLWYQGDCVELLCDGTGWIRIGGTGWRLVPDAKRPTTPVVNGSTTRAEWVDVDLSSYVPPGAKAVYLWWVVGFVGDDAYDYCLAYVRKNGTSAIDGDQYLACLHYDVNCADTVTSQGKGSGWVECDTDRVVEYYTYGASGGRADGILTLNIKGYSYE